jgi:hypothetical protein
LQTLSLLNLIVSLYQKNNLFAGSYWQILKKAYNIIITCGDGGTADTHASGACARMSVRVQIPFSAFLNALTMLV